MFKVVVKTVDHINRRCSVKLLGCIYEDKRKAVTNAKQRTRKTYDKGVVTREVNAFVQPYKNDEQDDIFDTFSGIN